MGQLKAEGEKMLQQVIEARLGWSTLVGKQEAGEVKKIEIDFFFKAGLRKAEFYTLVKESIIQVTALC